MNEYKDILDKFFKTFEDPLYEGEITKGREEYFKIVGKIYEDDNFFESRMSAFFEWFAFNRHFGKKGLTPVRIYYHDKLDGLSEEEIKDFENILNSVWSIFTVKNKTDSGCELEDLFCGTSYKVLAQKSFYLPESGNIVEARLLPFKGKYYLSGPVFSHPNEVGGIIRARAKSYKDSSRSDFQKFVLQLAGMSIKMQRYKHLPAKQIYKFE